MEDETYYLNHIDFSSPDTYEIEDSKNTIVYRARAKMISFGKVHELTDRAEVHQLEICNRMSNLTTYEFKKNGVVVLKVVQPFPSMSRFEADGSAGLFVLDEDEISVKRSNTIISWKIRDGEMNATGFIRRADQFSARYSILVPKESTADIVLTFGLAIVFSEVRGFGPNPL